MQSFTYSKPTLSLNERVDFSQLPPERYYYAFDHSSLSSTPQSTPEHDDIHDRASSNSSSPYQSDNIVPMDSAGQGIFPNYRSAPSTTLPLFNNHLPAAPSCESSPSPPPAERTQRKSSTRLRHLSGCPFIEKLYSLVNDYRHHNVIDWSNDGRCILFVMNGHFVTNVLGPNFRTKKVDSFIRQLNGYGFKRVYVTRGCRLLTKELEEVAVFSHYNFHRDGMNRDRIKRAPSSPFPAFTLHDPNDHHEAPRIITDDCSQSKSYHGCIQFTMLSLKHLNPPATHTGTPGTAH